MFPDFVVVLLMIQ